MRSVTNLRLRSKGILSYFFNYRLLLPFLLCLWFLFFAFTKISTSSSLRGGITFQNTVATKNLNDATMTIDNLVIVAGHAVIRLNQMKTADVYDSGWYLLPYQKDQGLPVLLSSHIKKGIELIQTDLSSALIFSGGQTRRDVGPTSEAASYFYLASEKHWMNSVDNRVFLEEYARDSFENLLFSVCRFREIYGKYPMKIKVVGFDFKAKRFQELHRKAIGFPEQNFSYVGVLSNHPKFNKEKAESGELIAIESFKSDLYGCNDPTLYTKREKRNPFHRTVPYELACPEMRALLKWCGPGLIDAGLLPWTVSKV